MLGVGWAGIPQVLPHKVFVAENRATPPKAINLIDQQMLLRCEDEMSDLAGYLINKEGF
jgi:hypothetical protein